MTDASMSIHTAKVKWERTGWCVLGGVIPDVALAAAQADLGHFFPSAEEFASDHDPERNRPFRVRGDAVRPRFPFESDSINLLAVHEVLIDLAEEILERRDLRLYQGLLSAKYSDGAPDDEQLLHADYGNHTLVVPRHDVGYEQLEMFVYLTDVTAETAATRMVSLERTTGIPVERTYLDFEEYADLYATEEPASGSAGSVLLYRPDTFHRGVAMTAPRSWRVMLHVAFKSPGTDWLGYQSWPFSAEGMPWHRLVPHLSVRQLCVLGFPAPGDDYWSEETLAGVSARYPRLDMSPWRSAFRTGSTEASAVPAGERTPAR